MQINWVKVVSVGLETVVKADKGKKKKEEKTKPADHLTEGTRARYMMWVKNDSLDTC